MIKELKDYFALFLLLMDLLASVVALTLSTLIVSAAYQSPGVDLFHPLSSVEILINFIPANYNRYIPLALISPLLLAVLDRIHVSNCVGDVRKYFQHSVIAVGITAGIGLLAISKPFSLKEHVGFIVGTGFVSFFLFISNRFLLRWNIMTGDKKRNTIKRLLIVGTNETALNLSQSIDTYPESGLRVAGFIAMDPEEVTHYLGNHKVVCTVEDFSESLKNLVVDCVLFSPDSLYLPYIDQLRYRCRIEGVDFAFLASEAPPSRDGVFIEKLGDFNLVFLKNVFQHPVKLAIKRMFDFLVTTVLICILWPLWFIIAILIKLDSKGPVFFKQERIGKNGRRFVMYKFRSMVADAEKYQAHLLHLNEMDGPAFKIKDDPRQTRFGRILRQTSLDELPQLFNVFRGDISLVGPRPPIFKEVMAYRPWERKRLSVIQGITCLWQISGRNNVKFDEWMKLDLMYIDNWSFAKDIKILLKTIPAVISKEGAR